MEINYNTENEIRINRIDSLNNLISEDANYKRNEKFINKIILKRMLSEELSTLECDSLRSLAQRCFLDEGRTVFNANGLCVKELAEYYSQDDCQDQLQKKITIRASKMENDSIFIRPNPASNQLFLKISKEWLEESIPEIAIFNIEGLKLDLPIKWLAANKTVCSISTGDIPNGIYIISVNSNNKHKIKKFTVQH